MDLRELQHLKSLCDHGHFGRAATALGITQPALTKSVQRLERSLGTPLVDRTSHGVLPTKVGSEVLARAAPLLSGADELRREIELLQGIDRGSLAVGIGPAMSESRVVEPLSRLLAGRSDVRIQICVDSWMRLSEWLLDRKIDLFIADITQAERDPRYVCRPLPREEFVWFCRAGHPLAKQRKVTRREMLKYPFALPRLPDWAKDWFAAEADRPFTADTSPFTNLIECEYYPILKRAVLAGDCISAALPSTIRSEIEAGVVVQLNVKAPAVTTQAGIVTLKGRSISPLAQALIDDLLERVASV